MSDLQSTGEPGQSYEVIEDDDHVVRRVQRVEPSSPPINTYYDWNQQRWRPSRLAFELRRGEAGLSVYGGALLAGIGKKPLDVAAEQDATKWTVASIVAGSVRDAADGHAPGVGLEVVHRPRTDEPARPCDHAHSLIAGFDALATKRLIKDVCRELADRSDLLEQWDAPSEDACLG